MRIWCGSGVRGMCESTMGGLVQEAAGLVRVPELWADLDPSRYGIAKDDQEDLYRRLSEELTSREEEDWAVVMRELGVLLSGLPCKHAEDLGQSLYAQFDYAAMGEAARGRLTQDQYRLLTHPWQAGVASAAVDRGTGVGCVVPVGVASRVAAGGCVGTRLDDHHVWVGRVPRPPQ